jgi:BolA-like protein 1
LAFDVKHDVAFSHSSRGHDPIKGMVRSKREGPRLIISKVTTAFQPSRLEIYNDSYQHAHHQAMQGSTSKETHFRSVLPGGSPASLNLRLARVYITSEAFKSKMRVARHKMVYALLKEDLEREGGIHALQLKTQTPEEEEKEKAKEGGAES